MENNYKNNIILVFKIVFKNFLLIMYSIFICKIVLSLQKYFFNVNDTLIFVTTNGFYLFLINVYSLILLPVIIPSHKNINKHFKIFRLKLIKIYLLLSIIIVGINLFSYCIITPDKIVIRDIRTFFCEKSYPITHIKNVKILSYKTKSSVISKYLIKVDIITINLLNSSINDKNYIKHISKIHKILIRNNIPVIFDITANSRIIHQIIYN